MTTDAPEAGQSITTLEPEQADRKRDLEDALAAAGRSAQSAREARAAALAEIGELLRMDQAAGHLVGTMAAGHITGLSRPTLNKARDEMGDGWGRIRELAQMVLAYDDDKGHATRLHGLFPQLGVIRNLALWLRQELAADIPFDPFGPDPETPEAVEILNSLYFRHVSALAEGQPLSMVGDASRQGTVGA